MKANRVVVGRLLAFAGAGSLILGITALSNDAWSKPPKPAKEQKQEAAALPAAEPPRTMKPIPVEPTGIKWGMTTKQLLDAVDTLLDEDYRPLYKGVSPGVKMKALDNALAEDKLAFKRSRVDFGVLPTGTDSTPLKSEYTYRNREALFSLQRRRETVHFFLIQEKLWKVVVERKLQATEENPAPFKALLSVFAGALGVEGRALEADASKGRAFREVDFRDSATHLRLIERGETEFAVAYEDASTLDILASLRVNKATDDSGIDPAVASAIRKEPAPEPSEPATKVKKAKR